MMNRMLRNVLTVACLVEVWSAVAAEYWSYAKYPAMTSPAEICVRPGEKRFTFTMNDGGEAWMDRTKSPEERAKILTAAMTLEEKADELLIHFVNEPELYAYFTNRLAHGRTFGAIMHISGAKQARALQEVALRTSRLRIPFIFHHDVTHGYRTVLPVGLGSASTWDTNLVERCEEMAAREAAAAGVHLTYAPMCDISDDPRWGRICETSGEEPFLSAAMTAARVRGFRKHVAACVKHFAGYAALRAGRDYHAADFSRRELEETYLAPYRAAIAENVDAVMCAYTLFDADAIAFNRLMNVDILRNELGFRGELMTDWQVIRSGERYGISSGAEESARRAMNAGIDVDMRSDIYGDELPALVRSGAVPAARLDEACARCLTIKFRLGLFDNPFARGCDPEVEAAAQITAENRALAREAVRKGAVILENVDRLLPLSTQSKVAVAGFLADAPKDQLGDWSPQGRTNESVTIARAMREAWGANMVPVSESETVVYCAGERVKWGGEHHSRMNPDVPADQLAEMRAFKAQGKKVVAVVLAARPLILTELRKTADAIIFSFFPGTEGGHGLVDVLSGAVNPSGRLVQTFPHAVGQIPLTHRERRAWAYDEWVDGTTKPLYPFGYGLSYTTYSVSKPEYANGCVSAVVKNTGRRAGVATVQLYLRRELASVVQRERELKGFQQVSLEPSESKTVSFALGFEELKLYDALHKWVDEPGPVTAYVGFDAATTNGVTFEHQATRKDVNTASPGWSYAKYPAMTSPREICVRPGERFTYAFTYASKKPYEIQLKGVGFEPVPKGLSFDAKTGILSGVPSWTGEKELTFTMNDGDDCVQWGDVKIKVYGAKKVPETLFNESLYQLDVANFTREGTFAAAERELKRLADLGITWVYLCPITAWDKDTDPKYLSRRQKASGFTSSHNAYRPADFMNVEPSYGTNDDFKRFVKTAHRLGMKVMTDVVFFHCGPKAVFLKEHPDWVKRDKDGNFVCGEWAFPQLNFANAGLRRYLTDSLLMWLRDYGVDGFRCDVGDLVPLDFWEAARPELDAAKPDLVMLLEGTVAKYGEKAFDMFYGFIASHNGINETLNEKMPASNIRRQWEKERAQGPAGIAWMRCTDTHDIASDNGERREELRWGHKRAECGLALAFALDGVPMLWMGQEIGWDKRYSIFGPTPIDWQSPPAPERAAVIRRLTALKREPAFGANGEIIWLQPGNPDDEVMFLRRAPGGSAYRCWFNLASGAWSIESYTVPF